MATTVVIVLNRGRSIERSLHHPKAVLFQVVDGPYTGRRSCLSCLKALTGDELAWDETRYSDYETCEIREVT